MEMKSQRIGKTFAQKWEQYEIEKDKLDCLNLSPAEYTEKIKEIVDRLGL